MAITLGGISLPGDLQWADEHTWSAVSRSADFSLTGALLIQESVLQAGRPITLSSDTQRAWITAATLSTLHTLNATPGWRGTLILADARTFTVAFRGAGLTAEPVLFQAPSGAADGWWKITLTLQTV